MSKHFDGLTKPRLLFTMKDRHGNVLGVAIHRGSGKVRERLAGTFHFSHVAVAKGVIPVVIGVEVTDSDYATRFKDNVVAANRPRYGSQLHEFVLELIKYGKIS